MIYFILPKPGKEQQDEGITPRCYDPQTLTTLWEMHHQLSQKQA